MDTKQLSRSGIGSFIVGLAGNIAIEVVQMTEWQISPELAKIIVYVCLALMLIGFILIISAFFKRNKGQNEQIISLMERLEIFEHKKRVDYREEHKDKKSLPNKLLQLDTYLADRINEQKLDIDTIKSAGKKLIRWYDWFRLLFMTITYAIKPLKKLFKGTHISYIASIATRFNIALCKVGLGTLPVVREDEQYKQLYGEIVQLESGLPINITAKIHRNITWSIQLNSLRIVNSSSPFWEKVQENPLGAKLEIVKNLLDILIMTVDNALTGLRSEVADDIENYFIGRGNE
ncbi:MAG: hypothetical protein WC967_16410 [Balneolaceae bacterium]